VVLRRGLARFFYGDPDNRIDAEANVASPQEAAEWLRANTVRRYPRSTFARRFPQSIDHP
jgi:disulfide oxidoreductase YuzD